MLLSFKLIFSALTASNVSSPMHDSQWDVVSAWSNNTTTINLSTPDYRKNPVYERCFPTLTKQNKPSRREHISTSITTTLTQEEKDALIKDVYDLFCWKTPTIIEDPKEISAPNHTQQTLKDKPQKNIEIKKTVETPCNPSHAFQKELQPYHHPQAVQRVHTSLYQAIALNHANQKNRKKSPGQNHDLFVKPCMQQTLWYAKYTTTNQYRPIKTLSIATNASNIHPVNQTHMLALTCLAFTRQ